MTENNRLLKDFVESRSDVAFNELVSRYIDLVYSTAIRLGSGDKHLADDATQVVFSDFARKASGFSENLMIGGWLHRHTCFVVWKMIRSEQRRKKRELTAASISTDTEDPDTKLEGLKEWLDEEINSLNSTDRVAIILRYFEGKVSDRLRKFWVAQKVPRKSAFQELWKSYPRV
ncbi:MAG: sigma-70 family RNA polymerase sigma factor [Verrucomicrobiota bacterium]|nr:sigma-70 family RNA polymerase sigma factor [Verrucomicrobiota bacterium]